MPRPHDCGAVPEVDSVFCPGCSARLGQERERPVMCHGCLRDGVWNRSGKCDRCEAHEDEVGARWADRFAEETA